MHYLSCNLLEVKLYETQVKIILEISKKTQGSVDIFNRSNIKLILN